MLRKNLIALALVAASTAAVAGRDDYVYGRVVSVEPHFVISIGGGRQYDGFRVLYDVGGQRYWTHSHRHPGHTIWVPRPYPPMVHHYRYRYDRPGWDNGWHDGYNHRERYEWNSRNNWGGYRDGPHYRR